MISVLIVTYNVRELLIKCLKSLQQIDDIEIIVVDNASKDGTCELLRNDFNEVRLICNNSNVGFARAINQAASIASGDMLLLLNPDMIVINPKCLQEMKDLLLYDSEIGMIGPKLNLANGNSYYSIIPFPNVVSVLLYEMRLNRLNIFSRYVKPHVDIDKGANLLFVDGVEGSCILLKKSTWKSAGGFDNRFFFGHEEIDFAWRIKKLGYKACYYPLPFAIHYHSGSSGGNRENLLLSLSITLALLYFLKKNRELTYQVLSIPLLWIFFFKWIICTFLGWKDKAIVFRESVRALYGLRPLWIMREEIDNGIF